MNVSTILTYDSFHTSFEVVGWYSFCWNSQNTPQPEVYHVNMTDSWPRNADHAETCKHNYSTVPSARRNHRWEIIRIYEDYRSIVLTQSRTRFRKEWVNFTRLWLIAGWSQKWWRFGSTPLRERVYTVHGLSSIVQVLIIYIYRSRHHIPDGIHQRGIREEASNVPLCRASDKGVVYHFMSLEWCGWESNPRPPAFDVDTVPLSHRDIEEVSCSLNESQGMRRTARQTGGRTDG